MNGVALNFNAANVAPQTPRESIPAGKYPMILIGSELTPNNNKPGQHIKLTWQFQGGQFDGRKLTDRLNVDNPNPQAVEIAYSTLSAICRAAGRMEIASTADLHGVPVLVTVKVKPASGEHAASNEIGGYEHISAAQTATPAGAPAWNPAGAAPAAFPAPAAAAFAAPAAPVAPAAPAFAQPAAAAPAFAGAAQPWQGAPLAAPATAAPAFAPPAPPQPPAPPAPAAPSFTMTESAGGATREQFHAAGWNDDQLIAFGHMIAAAPAAPVAGIAPPAGAPWA
jgi:hypothetical protein